MVQRILLNHYLARTAGMLSGAQRGAMMLVTLLFTLTAQTAWATIGGTGTKYDPYTINSQDDWNTFASNITNGTELYEGKYVKLTTDIGGITTMAGEYDNINKEFRGTFDGGGHTMTLNIASYFNNVAPFRRANGATIKNLYIAGTISGINNSGKVQYMAGLIARSYGNVTISNCRSSVDIRDEHSSSKEASHGGFIAVVESGTVTISNCLFDGRINDANATNCGGFIGWHGDDQQVTFNNCLMAGTMNITVDGNSATFSRNGSKMTTLNNCYYVTSYGAVQGTLVGEGSNTATPENLAAALNNGGEEWQVVSSKVVPVMVQDPNNIHYATVAGLKKTYQYDSGNPIAINFTVTNVEGTLLSTPTDYTVTIKNSSDVTVASVTDKGDYTLTVAGTGSKTSGYYGSQVFTFRVADAIDLSTITDHYTATNGEKLTGTLGANVKITIAAGATITLNGVTINGESNDKYPWAGLTCEGDATIILADGSQNTIKGFRTYYPGIYVPENSTLTIQGSTGKLNASSNGFAPGIGACFYRSSYGTTNACGNIVIEGGDITAVTSTNGAGIGGGYNSSCGDITISGGNVTATGAYNYPGIGTGRGGSSCGTITISGTANVTATGGYEAAGIGSGFYDSHCGNITISTIGTVIATSGGFGAGIGAGSSNDGSYISTCGDIIIQGGNITATGGSLGAGIGCGQTSTCGDITIQGGNITATGGEWGAGIGSSRGDGQRGYNRCGTITISGGTVSATGGNSAAGIGTGCGGTCGSISITADVTNVTAIKGEESPNNIGCGKENVAVPSKILDAGDVDGTITIADGLYDSGEGSASRTVCPYIILSESTGINATVAANITDKAVKFQRTGITTDAYSTVCLPFDFTAPTGCTIYGFQGIHYDENALGAGQGAWVADIAAASTMTAHTPYIFTCTGTEATFSGIASNAADYSSALESNAVSATEDTDQAWTFKGTYSAIDWSSANPTEPTYGFSTYVPAETIAAGTFVRFVQGASLAPFRARLIYSGTDTHLAAPKRSAATELPQYIIVRIVGADGNTTAIGTLDTRTGEISTGDWFDLNGRRLSGKPTQKGLYINNGNKVVIK